VFPKQNGLCGSSGGPKFNDILRALFPENWPDDLGEMVCSYLTYCAQQKHHEEHVLPFLAAIMCHACEQPFCDQCGASDCICGQVRCADCPDVDQCCICMLVASHTYPKKENFGQPCTTRFTVCPSCDVFRQSYCSYTCSKCTTNIIANSFWECTFCRFPPPEYFPRHEDGYIPSYDSQEEALANWERRFDLDYFDEFDDYGSLSSLASDYVYVPPLVRQYFDETDYDSFDSQSSLETEYSGRNSLTFLTPSEYFLKNKVSIGKNLRTAINK
jgi:hypothetical protein